MLRGDQARALIPRGPLRVRRGRGFRSRTRLGFLLPACPAKAGDWLDGNNRPPREKSTRVSGKRAALWDKGLGCRGSPARPTHPLAVRADGIAFRERSDRDGSGFCQEDPPPPRQTAGEDECSAD